MCKVEIENLWQKYRKNRALARLHSSFAGISPILIIQQILDVGCTIVCLTHFLSPPFSILDSIWQSRQKMCGFVLTEYNFFVTIIFVYAPLVKWI